MFLGLLSHARVASHQLAELDPVGSIGRVLLHRVFQPGDRVGEPALGDQGRAAFEVLPGQLRGVVCGLLLLGGPFQVVSRSPPGVVQRVVGIRHLAEIDLDSLAQVL